MYKCPFSRPKIVKRTYGSTHYKAHSRILHSSLFKTLRSTAFAEETDGEPLPVFHALLPSYGRPLKTRQYTASLRDGFNGFALQPLSLATEGRGARGEGRGPKAEYKCNSDYVFSLAV